MKRILAFLFVAIISANCYAGFGTGGGNKMEKYEGVEGDCLTFMDHHNNTAHKGYVFEASHRFVDVANDGYAKMFFVLGSTMNAEVLFDISSEGNSYIDGYSLTTVSSSGTLMTHTGKNFVTYKTPSAKAYYDPNVVSSGSLVFQDIIFGGTGLRTAGSSASEPIRWICNAGAYFMLVVQNKGGAAKDILIRAFWTEEPL